MSVLPHVPGKEMSLRGYKPDTSAGTRTSSSPGRANELSARGRWERGFLACRYCFPNDVVMLVAIVPRSSVLEGRVFRRLLMGHPLTQAWQRYRATRAGSGWGL